MNVGNLSWRERKQIVDLYAAGLTPGKIAKRLGRSYQAVWRIIKLAKAEAT